MSSENANLSLAKEYMPIIIPIVSVIAILMFLGVIGNAAVIYIYGFVLKKSTVHYFITVLAVFDFICCLLGFPLEIIEVYYAMGYPSSGLCKWQRFLTFCCSIGSISVLLLISIERYRKVCLPTNYQINLRHAKYFALGACLFSLLMASPIVFFSRNRLIILNQFKNQAGYDCRLSTAYGRGPLFYFISLLAFTTVILTIMIVLYGLLWRKARKHFLESDTRFQQNVNNAETVSSPAKRHLSRTNHTVISVTVLFSISFFPTLILSIFADRLMGYMNYTEVLVFSMFVRMYILSSSFNPLIYGFCNEYFRKAFVEMFWKILCISSMEIQKKPTETSDHSSAEIL